MPYLEAESLRPITRREFIRELGAAMAIDFILYWAIVAFAGLLCTFLLHRASLFHLLLSLSVSILIQIAAFGLMAWFMRQRLSGAFALAALILLPPAGLALGLSAADEPAWNAIGLCVAILVSLRGIVVARDAYRRWMITEWG
jgi:hypothetical protein